MKSKDIASYEVSILYIVGTVPGALPDVCMSDLEKLSYYWVDGPSITFRLKAHGGCDRSAEDADSSMTPDPSFAFVEGSCCPTLDFVCVFWTMITFNTLLLRHFICIDDKSLAEFNYKLIYNLLSNNLLISKWDRNVTNKCKQCSNEIENTKHLIFDCNNVQHIWKIASICIKFTVIWKHIVVGFYLDNNELVKIYNYFLSFIAFRIYKCKMYCRVVQVHETKDFVICSIKEYLKTHCQVLKRLRKTKLEQLFQNFVSKL